MPFIENFHPYYGQLSSLCLYEIRVNLVPNIVKMWVYFWRQVTENLQGGRKDILGCYYFKENISCFSVWKPNIWNKLCLMMDKQKKKFGFSLNDKQNLSITDHQLPDVNDKILLMNNKDLVPDKIA